jgi:cytochrome c oxidase assembly protein subunit 15
MSHGTLAQVFLCITAWIAYASSREFVRGVSRHSAQPVDATRMPAAWRAVRVALGCVFIQLLLGAWVRHSEAGLAVPFYPLSDTGSLLPEYTNRLVWIHMTHRLFAVVVFLAVWRGALASIAAVPALLGHGAFLAGLLFLQGVLGATVVWVEKAPFMTSLHVMNGAAVLVSTWLLVLRTWRAREELREAPADVRAAVAPSAEPRDAAPVLADGALVEAAP